MTVLILFYDSAIGGGQKAIGKLADLLEPCYTIKRISIKPIDSPNITWLGNSRLLYSARALLKLYRNERANYVFTTLFGCGLLLLTLKIATFGRIKYVYREATNVALGLSKLERFLTYFIIKMSSVTVFNSKEQINELAILHNNLSFVPNIYETAKITRIRNNRIVMIGRCVKMKNFELGIELLHQVKQYKLVIYTTDSDLGYLDQLRLQALDKGVLNRIEFVLNETDKDVMYSNELLYIASDYEGSPNILFEALSRGVPVLAHQIKYGINEFIDPGVSGVVLKSRNITSEIREIIWRLRDLNPYTVQENFCGRNLLEIAEKNLYEIFNNN